MELNRPVDARAYALGVCDAFCEVVRAGVKRIALSHPFTQDELDTVLGADFIRDCTAIAAQYGCGAHHQTEPLLTDLFPISLNAGRQNVIFYRDPADLEAFLGICRDKSALVASGAYTGDARREIAVRFGRLLSYSEEAIDRLIAQNTEREPDNSTVASAAESTLPGRFFIAGRARNRDYILHICRLFDDLHIPRYCFLENDASYQAAGLDGADPKLAETVETLDLHHPSVRALFEHDLRAERDAENFLLVLPAGKSAHIEAGIAYGLGKRCYAVGPYDTTDTLYHIFEKIFRDENELKAFLADVSRPC